MPKKLYDEKYKNLVDALLVAYADFDRDPLLACWVRKLTNPMYQKNLGMYDLSAELRDIGPQKSVETMFEQGLQAGWVYSFWIRRANEGKKDEVYQTLKMLQSDYAAMES